MSTSNNDQQMIEGGHQPEPIGLQVRTTDNPAAPPPVLNQVQAQPQQLQVQQPQVQAPQVQGQVQLRQPNQLPVQQSPSEAWVRDLAAIGQNAVIDDRQLDDAAERADAVVKEFAPQSGVGLISKWKRKRAFKDKKKIYDSQAATDWRSQRNGQRPAPPAVQMDFRDPANLSPAARVKIYDMMHEDIDFTGYTDDRIFVNKFDMLYEKLRNYEKIHNDLKDAAWDAPGAEATLRGYPMLESFTLEKIKARAKECVTNKQFYEAKMDLLTNPFYLILRKSDTHELEGQALDDKIRVLSATSPGLAEYLSIMRRLKALEADGIKRKHADYAALYKTEVADGLDKHTKGHFAVGTVRKSLSFTGPKYDMGFYGVKAKDRNSEDEDDRKFKQDTSISHKGNLEAEAGLTFTLVEGSAEKTTEDGRGKASMDFQIGEFKVYGNVSASIFSDSYKTKDKDGKESTQDLTSRYVGAEVGASATGAKLKGSASFDSKVKWYKGSKYKKAFEKIKLFDASISASGEAFKASATASAKAGRFVEKKEKEDVLVEGAAVKAGVSASLLSGKIKGEITLFGVKIGLSATGNIGSVGASVGLKAKGGRIGASLSANLGIGAKLGFYIDASAWVSLFKDVLAEETAEMRESIKKSLDQALDGAKKDFNRSMDEVRAYAGQVADYLSGKMSRIKRLFRRNAAR